MNWSEEKGLFGISQSKVEGSFRDAGLERIQSQRYGFFPPPLLQRSEWLRQLESRLGRSSNCGAAAGSMLVMKQGA